MKNVRQARKKNGDPYNKCLQNHFEIGSTSYVEYYTNKADGPYAGNVSKKQKSILEKWQSIWERTTNKANWTKQLLN